MSISRWACVAKVTFSHPAMDISPSIIQRILIIHLLSYYSPKIVWTTYWFIQLSFLTPSFHFFPLTTPLWTIILLFIYLFIHLFIFVFSGPHQCHMEVPMLGIESELQLWAYTTATAMQDRSHICDLYHSLWQCWILNPLRKACMAMNLPLRTAFMASHRFWMVMFSLLLCLKVFFNFPFNFLMDPLVF